jgi:hypothetical protein
VLRANVSRNFNQFSVALREPIFASTNVVLEPGSDRIATPGQNPVHDGALMTSYSGRRPRGFGKDAFKFTKKEIHEMLFRRHRVFDSHDELHVGMIIDQALINQPSRPMNMGQVKDLDFRPDPVLAHLRREMANESRGILVNDRWEVNRTGGKRTHVWFENKGAPSFAGIAATPARRKLDNHSWTMPLHALKDLGKKLGIRGGGLIRAAHVNMDKRRSSFECLVSGLDLLCGCDWQSRIIALTGN